MFNFFKIKIAKDKRIEVAKKLKPALTGFVFCYVATKKNGKTYLNENYREIFISHIEIPPKGDSIIIKFRCREVRIEKENLPSKLGGSVSIDIVIHSPREYTIEGLSQVSLRATEVARLKEKEIIKMIKNKLTPDQKGVAWREITPQEFKMLWKSASALL